LKPKKQIDIRKTRNKTPTIKISDMHAVPQFLKTFEPKRDGDFLTAKSKTESNISSCYRLKPTNFSRTNLDTVRKVKKINFMTRAEMKDGYF